jgi:hypothetical protein
MKNFILTLFCLFLVSVCFSQEVSVSGTLVDKISKETVAGIPLKIDGKQSAMTDLNGSFSVILKKGKHLIQFTINNNVQEIELNVKEEDLDLKIIELDFTIKNLIRLGE